MHKTYQDRNKSKRYTLLDNKVEKLIELPYMERPIYSKLNINEPKFIKSKLFYVKGWIISSILTNFYSFLFFSLINYFISSIEGQNILYFYMVNHYQNNRIKSSQLNY